MPSSDHSSGQGWAPPSVEQLQVLLPQYEISEIIGRGGMGAVYRGLQAELDREVAIKILPEIFIDEDDSMNLAKRFEHEARAMAKLNHPAIISVYDFGETTDGQLYIVMEYIHGMNVDQYLHRHDGRLPQDHALAITTHVIDALAYAHRHGIVHRDIKPGNILLNHEGRVKIADFGLAKQFTEGNENGPSLTKTHVTVGTPEYLAPESYLPGTTPDHRADLYAVGIMLYQMLTGMVPRGHFKNPSVLHPELDPRIDGIVDQLMQADPEDRYPSASAVREDLDSIFTTPITKISGGGHGETAGSPRPLVGPSTLRTIAKAKDRRVNSKKPSKAPLFLALGLTTALVIGGLVWMQRAGDGKNSADDLLTLGPDDSEIAEPKNPGSDSGDPAIAAMDSQPADSGKTSTASASEEGAGNEAKAPISSATGGTEEEPATRVNLAVAPKPGPAIPSKMAETGNPAATATAPPLLKAATIPGLEPRLKRYLEARRKQVGSLASNYDRGLDTRIGRATASGDLNLVEAFRAEKARVAGLVEALTEPLADPVAAIAAPVSLAPLPDDTLTDLATIRETWSSEQQKLQQTLDVQLLQSLQALESELTKKGEIEIAETLMAWRKSLEAAGLAALVNVAKAPTSPADAASETTPNRPPLGSGQSSNSGPPPHPLQTTESQKLGIPVHRENSLGMEFRLIPAGEFIMGSEDTNGAGGPARKVVISKPFYFGAHEVTQKHFQNLMNRNPSVGARGDDHAVGMVTWYAAVAFCNKLSDEEKLRPCYQINGNDVTLTADGEGYRLPTEAEWEYACRAGTNTEWFFGDDPTDLEKYAWFSDNSGRETQPVGQKLPNPFGLYDIVGNNWEWCYDRHGDIAPTTETLVDPLGPADGNLRVERGRFWISNADDFRSWQRYGNNPGMTYDAGGLRVVLNITGK